MKRSKKLVYASSKRKGKPFRFVGLLIAFSAFACIPALAQQSSLSLASGSAKPGGSVALSLSLTNSAGTQPGSLEWTMTYPASDISGVSVAVSSSASVAHKTVNCNNSSSGSTVCVLSGLDENTIPAGTVATATFQVAANSQDKSIPVQLAGMGADAEGSLLPVSATGGTITSTGSSSSEPPPSSGAVSVWATTARPGTITASDSSAVELGMKFRSDVAGQVTGVRFYKGPQNTGTHLGHLWSNSGKLLAKVTFQNETASGWQQALFATPVSIQANTTYIISYYAPRGYYSADNTFFNAGVNTPPLHALKSGTDGPNGVYKYGSSAFPNNSWQASNYWVDVLFVPSSSNSSSTPTASAPPAASASVWAPDAVPGTISDSDSNSVELGMKFRSDVAGQVTAVRFYKGPRNTGTHIGSLWSSNGTLLGRVTFQDETGSGWQQADFATPVPIQANTTYIVSYLAPAGHYSSDGSFFSSPVDTPPLHALKDGADGSNGVYRYGSGGFPNESWNASNYWVDVVFTPSSK